MIGTGHHMNDHIRTITFLVVLIIKIKKSENQIEATKNTFKLLGGVTLMIIFVFFLIKLLYWRIDINEVLGKQILYLVGLFCWGIMVPSIIIKRSQTMTEYMQEYIKENIYNLFPQLETQQNDEIQSR